MLGRMLSGIIRFIYWLLAPEKLEFLPGQQDISKRGFWKYLFSSDSLSAKEMLQMKASQPPFIRWLLSRENLNEVTLADEASFSRRQGFLGYLFTSEALVIEETPQKEASRPSFIYWLFSREQIDIKESK